MGGIATPPRQVRRRARYSVPGSPSAGKAEYDVGPRAGFREIPVLHAEENGSGLLDLFRVATRLKLKDCTPG